MLMENLSNFYYFNFPPDGVPTWPKHVGGILDLTSFLLDALRTVFSRY
jgi:hypothetical protein